MFGHFIAAMKTGRAVRLAQRPHDDTDGLFKRRDAIEQLGRLPLSEESLTCLTAFLDRVPADYSLRNEADRYLAEHAAKALAGFQDPRVSRALARRLRGPCHGFVEKALSNARHQIALPEILAAADPEVPNGRCEWLEAILQGMGTTVALAALDKFRRASVPWIVKAARATLRLGNAPACTSFDELRSAVGFAHWRGLEPEQVLDWIGQDLQPIDSDDAREALSTLRREMVPILLRIALTSSRYEDVRKATQMLDSFDSKDARQALKQFRDRPSRKLIRTDHHEDCPQDRMAPIEWTTESEHFSSVFGQAPSAEERLAAVEQQRRRQR